MGTSTVIISSDIQQLLYYETPLTEFTAESSSLPATHTTTLTCTATGGYPPVDSITLYKNNELIMRTSSDALQYNTTTSSQYGRYECVVDSKIHSVQKGLLLQEEGHLMIVFKVKQCSIWTSKKVQEFKTALSGFIGEIPDQPAASTLFMNSSLSCSSSSLTFSSILTYSSEDGSLTATDLINRINLHLSGKGASISVGGALLHIHNTTSSNGLPTRSSNDSMQLPLMIGFFFGGAGSSLLVICVIVTIVAIPLKLCKKKTSTTSSTDNHSWLQAVPVSLANPPVKPKPQQCSSVLDQTLEYQYQSNPSYEVLHAHLYEELDNLKH